MGYLGILRLYLLEICFYLIWFADLSFGNLFIWKLHQVHFVFLLIVLGYLSLLYHISFSPSLDLISIAGKDFTSHGVILLSFFVSSYFLLLKLCYLYPSFGHLFIHYLLQL